MASKPPPSMSNSVSPSFELNEMQSYGRDMIPMLIERTDNKCGILLGKGGSGKTTTVSPAQELLKDVLGEDVFGFFATTGKAASHLPGGCTLHSQRNGLSLPVGKEKYKPLSPRARQRLYEQMQNFQVFCADEYSMMRQRELHYINMRLQENFGNNSPFGGRVLLLLGDPANTCCWWESALGPHKSTLGRRYQWLSPL